MRAHLPTLLPSLALGLSLPLIQSCAASGPIGPEEDSYVQTEDGTLLHFRKFGSGEEALIVPGDNWIGPDIEKLAAGRTVVFYDCRGRGLSEARTTTSLAKDLEDLEAVRKWFGFESISLLGMDYQAALVAWFAKEHPELVDELVLLSPIPARKFPYWKIYYQIFNERRDPDLVKELNDLKRNGVPRKDPDAWAAAYLRVIVTSWVLNPRSANNMKSQPYVGENRDPERSIVRYFEMLRSLGDWDWREPLGEVSAATLVVYGDSDPMPVEALREWAASMPNAEEAVIEKSGRMPWIEQPRKFFSAVDGFLKKQ
jgi:proline iminopeptidase